MADRLKNPLIAALSLFCAASLMLAALPTQAYAAVVLGATDGEIRYSTVDKITYAGQGRIEYDSAFNARGRATLQFTGTTGWADTGTLVNNVYVYQHFHAQKWLIANYSSSNPNPIYAGHKVITEAAGPVITAAYMTTEVTHRVPLPNGTRNFGSTVGQVFSPGWPLPFSLDLPHEFDGSETPEGSAQLPLATNPSGQTYGSARDMSTPADQPDLIGVVATNGELGYVYYEDFYAATIQGVDNVELDESIARFEERDLKVAQALKESANEKYGAEVLTVEDALAALELMGTTENGEAVELANDRAMQNAAPFDISSARTNALDADTFDDMVFEARKATGSILPVYLSDGTTEIGEFLAYTV